MATVHCLTGCTIGEVLGMVIGTALGWTNWPTVALVALLPKAFRWIPFGAVSGAIVLFRE